jgi:hypothetical protein
VLLTSKRNFSGLTAKQKAKVMNNTTMNVATWSKAEKGYHIMQKYGDLNITLTRQVSDTPKEAFQLLNRTYYQ